MEIKTTEVGATPRRMSREMGRIQRESLEQVGIYWHQNFRAKHFKPSGAKEYGYTKRKGEGLPSQSKEFRRSYMGRKLRQRGHQKPLTWSGETEQRTQIRDVRATRNKVRIVIHAPALNFRSAGSQINMREEMTTVSPAEQQVLTDVFQEEMQKRLDALG